VGEGSGWLTCAMQLLMMVMADWSESWLASVYNGKGDTMECGSYRRIKMLQHVLKILERIVDLRDRR